MGPAARDRTGIIEGYSSMSYSRRRDVGEYAYNSIMHSGRRAAKTDFFRPSRLDERFDRPALFTIRTLINKGSISESGGTLG